MSGLTDLLTSLLPPHLFQPGPSWPTAGVQCRAVELQGASVWLCLSPRNCAAGGSKFVFDKFYYFIAGRAQV